MESSVLPRFLNSIAQNANILTMNFRHPLLCVLLVSLLVLGTACDPADDPVAELDVCGSGGPLTAPGGDLNGPYMKRTLITKFGNERTWLLRLPAGYEEGTPADVVFNFHGATSNALDQFVYGDFRTQADRDGVILVVPDANKVFEDPTHELAGYWNSAWEANLRTRDYDIDFILELVDLVQSEYCTGDFFAAGMSAGGDMVSALECQPDSPFKAYAPVTYRYYNDTECAESPPKPLISFHGDKDFVVPIAGSDAPWLDPPVADVMQAWAEHNGCDPKRLEKRVSDEVLHFWWANCDAPTEWYLVEGGGHTWPGAVPVPELGHTTEDISASDLIWDLFFGPTTADEQSETSG